MRTLHLLLALSCITVINCQFPGRYVAAAQVHDARSQFRDRKNFTEMTFYSTFHCNITGIHCLTGFYEEADRAGNNEYVLTLPFYCHNSTSLSFTTITNFTGYDGFSSDYDPALELFHNCSSSGKIHQIIKKFNSVHVLTSFAEFQYSIDLTDSGLTDQYAFEEVPADRSSKWPSSIIDWIFHKVPIHTFHVPEDAPYFNQTKFNEGEM